MLTKPSEETKPVERESFDDWVRNVESQRPDDHCAMHAAWDAALERAEEIINEQVPFIAMRDHLLEAIRALKER